MIKVGITMGDPAGIGPEIILKALNNDSLYKQCKFIIYGDRKVFSEIDNKFRISNMKLENLEFVDLNLLTVPIKYGVVRAEYGKAAGDYIKKSIEDAINKKIDVIVTAPIHKKSFQLGGYGKKYPGHTEMLADLTKTKDCTMMLAYKNVRVLHVTTHEPLRTAIDGITQEKVYKTIKLGYETCKKLNIEKIRIGVAGLNPHAGDNGLFGWEDIEEISPAVNKAKMDFNCVVEGPIPSDTLFSKALGGMYDMVIAMYHDQGHIPLKTLGFTYNHEKLEWTEVSGVNVTLGLPIIRVSVDHGTAFGKAGKGTANADSIIEAIQYAILLSK